MSFSSSSLYSTFFCTYFVILYYNNFIYKSGGWPGNSGPGQYNRGQYVPPQPNQQPWNSGQRPPGPPGPNQTPGGQWDQHRYPLQGQQPPYPPNQSVCVSINNLYNTIKCNVKSVIFIYTSVHTPVWEINCRNLFRFFNIKLCIVIFFNRVNGVV